MGETKRPGAPQGLEEVTAPFAAPAAADTDPLESQDEDAQERALPLPPSWFAGAQGFDPEFLEGDTFVPLPKLAPAVEADLALLADGSGGELRYRNASILMSRSRRLALVTAVAIDGGKLQAIKRKGDPWRFDPRLDQAFQSGPELYARNSIDRGHLNRRVDPCWGTKKQAQDAEVDTFHFTNCAPQLASFNQKTWQELESFVIDTAGAERDRVVVFTGPVFRPDDQLYRDEFLIPADFWKVVVFTNKKAKLRAVGYMRTQRNLIPELGEVARHFDDEYKDYQVPVAMVEQLTGLDFVVPEDADPLFVRTRGPARALQVRAQIVRLTGKGSLKV